MAPKPKSTKSSSSSNSSKAGSIKPCQEQASGSSKKESKAKQGKQAKLKFKESCNWGKDDLEEELAALGLRIKQITADGNCFFRAVGDQLKGDEGQHVRLRALIVDHMRKHQDDFAPFVEDDEPFDKYMARMAKDGVWAGYMEVIAASQVLQVHLNIYQAGQPRWTVTHCSPQATTLHLSYHDGQHYNSVRMAEDLAQGPPLPVVLRQVPGVARAPSHVDGDEGWDEKAAARVRASTACHDRAVVAAALKAAQGDVDLAIEKVIELLSQQCGDEKEGCEDTEAKGPGQAAEAPQPCPAGQAAVQLGSSEQMSDIGSLFIERCEGHEPPEADAGQASQQTADDNATAGQQGEEGEVHQHLSHSLHHCMEGQAALCSQSLAGKQLVGHEEVFAAAELRNTAQTGMASMGTREAVAVLTCTVGTNQDEHSTYGSGSSQHAASTKPAEQQRQWQPSPKPSPDPSHGETLARGIEQHSASSSSDEGGGGPPRTNANTAGIKVKAATMSGKGVRVGSRGAATGAKAPSRNKQCPCGSKQKYKNCCGSPRRLAAAEGGSGSKAAIDPASSAAQLKAIVL